MTDKRRLDQELVRRGIAENLDLAARYVGAGQVWVNGSKAVKADERVQREDRLEFSGSPRFVSRGGFKLEGVLACFEIKVEGTICADIGASTGGFTDCLLQYGAAKVYAIDVGRGQLHWKLRQDERVTSLERSDIRQFTSPIELTNIVTIDVSFISLERVLPAAIRWLHEDGQMIALLKPQFEADPAEVGPGGVIRSWDVHSRLLRRSAGWFAELGIGLKQIVPSTVLGPKGNQEFFLWGSQAFPTKPIEALLDDLLAGS